VFKELKVIKLVIIAAVLGVILYSTSQGFRIRDVFISGTFHRPGDRIIVQFSANYHAKETVDITTLTGKSLAKIDLEADNNVIDESHLRKGFSNGAWTEFNIPWDWSPGIYSLDSVPLLIGSWDTTEITVVYPMANNCLYHPYNGETIFSTGSDRTDLDRKVPICDYTRGLNPIF